MSGRTLNPMLVLCFLSMAALSSRAYGQDTEISPESLQGRWIVFTETGESERIVEFAGTTFSFESIKDDGPPMTLEFEVLSTVGPQVVIGLSQGGEQHRASFVFRSADEFIMLSLEGDELIIGYRLGEMPAEFLGDWVLHNIRRMENDHIPAAALLTVDHGMFLFHEGAGQSAGYRIYETVATGPVYNLALQSGSSAARLFYMEPLGDGGYILYREHTNEHVLLYRPDVTPTIQAETTETTETGQ